MSGRCEGFDRDFWRGKKVWVTGHTGFKGAWLCAWLSSLGAVVKGSSLPAPARESLGWIAAAQSGLAVEDGRLDIQDAAALAAEAKDFAPDVVFHLAAQAIVLDSHEDMAGTWGPNVMGTLATLQAAADAGAKAIVVATSDKCYKNKGWAWGYREVDELGGDDPYSASKAACELLVDSWRASRGKRLGVAVATARAGNVIGGGDNAPWRLLPDMLRAFGQGIPGQCRNPESTRPFQHALEPLSGYMLLARRLWEQAHQGGPAFDEPFNFGPGADGERSARWLASQAAKSWGGGARVECAAPSGAGREARVLMLDSSKAKSRLGWAPVWDASVAVDLATRWEKARLEGGSAAAMALTRAHVARFEQDALAAQSATPEGE
jgi:CDP-glucose 4,6-dehydratase